MPKTLLVAMLSVAALAGCGKKKASPPASAEACAGAAHNLAAILFADVKQQHPNVDASGETTLAGTVQTSCVGDQWGEDIAKCYTDGKNQADLKSCAKLFTKEQDRAFDMVLKTVDFTEPAPAGGGGAAPAAGGGSAAPAAGSAEPAPGEGGGSAAP